MTFKDKTLIAALGAFATLVVGLAVVGAFQSYSPVPYKDMWDGYLGFYEGVARGDSSAWWYQHNEHRILLARLLFWADLAWFDGRGRLLILANYLLVGASAFLYWRILSNLETSNEFNKRRLVLGLFVTAWLFLWMQEENLTWGFQSAFILAQLLPLCALYWMHKAISKDRSRDFVIACGFGVASACTMANGVLALPLMTVFAILKRQRATRIAVLAALSIATLFYYFHEYQTVDQHGSLLQTFREKPLIVIQYVLLYFGSPFHYLVGRGTAGPYAALVAGLVLVIASVAFAARHAREPRNATLKLALLFFLLYIAGTAIGTAGGRLMVFGLDQALSSRYTTPAIMAWATLFVLSATEIENVEGVRRTIAKAMFWILVLLMIPLQLKALHSQENELFERRVAALALALQINDRKQISHVYPVASAVLSRANTAAEKSLSIFGMFPFKEARNQIGTFAAPSTLPACAGHLDSVETIDGDSRFLRVGGWAHDSASNSSPEVVRILNEQRKVVGYALAGQPRPDVAKAVGKHALHSGYRGYVLSSSIREVLTLQGETSAGPVCGMQSTIREPL